jgi:FkbM family methyltransferase
MVHDKLSKRGARIQLDELELHWRRACTTPRLSFGGCMIAASRLFGYLGRATELISAERQTPAVGRLLARFLEIGDTSYPVHVPLKDGGGLTLASLSELKVFWEIFVHGCYALPKTCKSILDCGANVGIFSVWAARHRPDARIVALEPFPETYAALEANIRANDLDRRVCCVPLALADASGERRLQAGGESPDRKLLPDDLNDGAGETVGVRCVTLAECLDLADFETVDLVKMDIEGSEWGVLLSTPASALARVRNLQLEYHEVNARFGYTPEKLFAHLAAAGLVLTRRLEDAHRTGLAYFERLPRPN